MDDQDGLMDEHERIKSDIVAWMMEHALGRENAKPRRMLIYHLRRERFHDVSDRTLRRIYGQLAVGYSSSNPKGIFWIATQADLVRMLAEQGAKARGCWDRARKVEAAVSESKQLSLGI